METILVAEDEPEVRDYLAVALTCEGYTVCFAENGEEVVSCLKQKQADYSLLLLDLIMPKKDGFETLKEVRLGWPDLPVITLSGSCTPANVATVLKGGASDFLSKPVAHEDLGRAIRNVLDASGRSSHPGTAEVSMDRPFWEAPSQDSWPQRVTAMLDRLAHADVPVLLRGETGVGKEVLARALHRRSARAGRPFLKLNCAALPSELVESELFGYEKGAFTGAFKNVPGKFEMANGGTILLDEIGDMDFKLQAKLLQVLQDREFHRLGSKDVSRVDVRVMAATHCDLEKAVTEGKFREDLYYRLNIVEIHVPPLRERRDEIISLANTFLQKHSPTEQVELPSRLQSVLMQHDWPGNVRELENVMRKFLVFRSVDVIAQELLRKNGKRAAAVRLGMPFPLVACPPVSSLPVYESGGYPIPGSVPSQTGPFQPLAVASACDVISSPVLEPSSRIANEPSGSILARVAQAKRESERDAILQALNTTLWNRKNAARLLKIDYKALLYKMKKLGIGANASEEVLTHAV